MQKTKCPKCDVTLPYFYKYFEERFIHETHLKSKQVEIEDSEDYRMVDLTDEKLAVLKDYGVFVKVKNDTWLEILLGRDNVQEIYDELLGDRK